MITKSDLARYDRERATLVVAVEDKSPAFDVPPTTILAAVVRRMVKNGLHPIFVTEGDKETIKGIITTFDILMVMDGVLNGLCWE